VAQPPPPIFGPCLLWPNGRPSQLLLSTCCTQYSLYGLLYIVNILRSCCKFPSWCLKYVLPTTLIHSKHSPTWGAQSLMSLNRFILLMQLLYWILKFCNDFYRATLCYSTVYATTPFMSVRLSVSPSVTSRKVNLDRFLTIVEWFYCHLRIYFFPYCIVFLCVFSVAV